MIFDSNVHYVAFALANEFYSFLSCFSNFDKHPTQFYKEVP